MLRKVTHHPYMSGGPPHGAYVVKIRQIGAHNHLVEKLACEGRFCVLPWSATPQPAATNRAVDLVGEFRDARKVVPLVADGIFAVKQVLLAYRGPHSDLLKRNRIKATANNM